MRKPVHGGQIVVSKEAEAGRKVQDSAAPSISNTHSPVWLRRTDLRLLKRLTACVLYPRHEHRSAPQYKCTLRLNRGRPRGAIEARLSVRGAIPASVPHGAATVIGAYAAPVASAAREQN